MNTDLQLSGMEGLGAPQSGGGGGGFNLNKLFSDIANQKKKPEANWMDPRMLQQALRPQAPPPEPRETFQMHMTPQGVQYKTYLTGPRQGQAQWGQGAGNFGHYEGTPIVGASGRGPS
jgi:hypothetical protein